MEPANATARYAKRKTMKHLFELIPYRRTVWITGFLKTTVSSAMITTGVEIGIVLGSASIIMACIYIAMIDRWKESRKKEELDTIEDYINQKAEEIANMKVLRKLEELEDD